MPAAYTIDAERRLVISRAWGTLITAEVAAHYRAIAADPRFDPAFRQMADLTAVERIAMRAASVRREALETVFDTRALRAFVVANAEQESAALLYGRFGRYVGQNVRVFREIEDAERWLGLAPTRRVVHDGQSAEPRA